MAQHRAWINISQIEMDRWPINPDTLALVDFIRKQPMYPDLPPIHVQLLPTSNFRILDGRHRVCALKLLGIEWIYARYGSPTLWQKAAYTQQTLIHRIKERVRCVVWALRHGTNSGLSAARRAGKS